MKTLYVLVITLMSSTVFATDCKYLSVIDPVQVSCLDGRSGYLKGNAAPEKFKIMVAEGEIKKYKEVLNTDKISTNDLLNPSASTKTWLKDNGISDLGEAIVVIPDNTVITSEADGSESAVADASQVSTCMWLETPTKITIPNSMNSNCNGKVLCKEQAAFTIESTINCTEKTAGPNCLSATKCANAKDLREIMSRNYQYSNGRYGDGSIMTNPSHQKKKRPVLDSSK